MNYSLKMSGQRHFCVFIALVGLVIVTAKPPPKVSPWAAMYAAKPVYARSLGPPDAGFDTITVPYGPKSSPFAPKFVDPKSMISKKTDLLSNLFGGVGPVNYPGAASSYPKFGPPVLYASGGVEANQEPVPYSDSVAEKNEVSGVKRAIFGPMGPLFGPGASPYGPFAPASTPFGPFGPYGAFGAKFSPKFPAPYDSAASSRRRRSIVAGPTTKDVVPPPPAYPGLATISEEPESAPPAPKEYLPGIFGPFGPYAAYGGFAPVAPIDPSYFAPKKPTFLDSLFSNMASTPVPDVDPSVAPVDTTTELPVTTSTIVPPGFWAPSGIIPGPTEYTDKVNFFLTKLFNNIAMGKLAKANATTTKSARSVAPEADEKVQVARSIDDLSAVSAAKDAIVDAIVAELGSLKTDMAKNLDDFVVAQKAEAAKPVPGKKPVKPIKAAFASFWGAPPVDTALPFQQKMSVLSQVFDMLTDLQKNITLAVTDAIKASSTTDAPVDDDSVPQYAAYYYPPAAPVPPVFNVSFLDAIKNKIASLETPVYQPYGYATGKFARAIAKGPSPNYLPYPESVKNSADQYKRAVKMSMHQGYQSMPPGTVETVQAGGGSTADHQGGGFNLLIQMPKNEPDYIRNDEQHNYNDWNKYAEWGEYVKNQYKNQKNHHNHH